MAKVKKVKREKLPHGRPSKYTVELGRQIAQRVSKGEPLAQQCREEGMPPLMTVYDWLRAHEEFAVAYAQARVAGYDMIAQEAMRIADEEPPEVVTLRGGVSKDAAHVAWQRVRIETRLKLLAKWDPKRYGETMNMKGSVEHNHTHAFPVSFANAMARTMGNVEVEPSAQATAH